MYIIFKQNAIILWLQYYNEYNNINDLFAYKIKIEKLSIILFINICVIFYLRFKKLWCRIIDADLKRYTILKAIFFIPCYYYKNK